MDVLIMTHPEAANEEHPWTWWRISMKLIMKNRPEPRNEYSPQKW